jgi:uncharacterized membrane protein YjdF
VGFVVGKAALGRVFSEYFSFRCQAFDRSLHIIRGWYSKPVVASVIVDSVPLQTKNIVISKIMVISILVIVAEH